MTISSSVSRIAYSGNGASMAFGTSFAFFGSAELDVVLISSAGAATYLLLGTDYTVTGGNGSTGQVATTVAPPAGSTLSIFRLTNRTQTIDLTANDAADADMYMRGLDRAAALSAELWDRADRAVRAPIYEAALSELPPAATRALMLFGFDALGNVATYPVASVGAVDLSNSTALASGTVTPRSLAARLADMLNVLDFGADRTGVADSTNAFNLALALGTDIWIPSGRYLIAGTINIALNGTTLHGAGDATTTLVSNSTTLPLISIASAFEYVSVRGVKLDRTATPVAPTGGAAPAAGIYTSPNATINRASFIDVISTNHWNGFALGAVSDGKLTRCASSSNYSDGILLSNSAGATGMQWDLESSISELNNGIGLHVKPHAGTVVTMGTYVNFTTYANAGGGISFDGPSANIEDVRFIGCTLSSDNLFGINCDTYGVSFIAGTVFIELVGTQPTGRNLGTPASNVGNGFYATANADDVTLSNFLISFCANQGVVTNAISLMLDSCEIMNNGMANPGTSSTPGTWPGVISTSATAFLSVINCKIGNDFGVYNQSYSIDTTAGASLVIDGNNFQGYNAPSPVNAPAPSALMGANNLFWPLTKRGASSIAVSATSVVVTHGCAFTPNTVFLQPTSAYPTPLWVDPTLITSSTFTVKTPTAPTGANGFNWEACCATQA